MKAHIFKEKDWRLIPEEFLTKIDKATDGFHIYVEVQEAKANALPVVNPEVITTDEVPGEPGKPYEVGKLYEWPGTWEKVYRDYFPEAKLIAPQQPQPDKTDNELVAEFMGIVFWKQIQGQKYYKVPKEHVYVNNANLGQFRYDKSWDWLMPVWQKMLGLINEHKLLNRNFTFWGDWYSKVTEALINARIDEFHSLIVKGIKHFNEQIKQL